MAANFTERYTCYDINELTCNDQSRDQSIIEELQCQICLQDVVSDPVMCNQCDKIFGYQCVIQMNKNKNKYYQCPNCKAEWKNDIKTMRNRFARDQIGNLFKISCQNKELGCQTIFKCKKEEILKHSYICQYQKVKCKNKDKFCNWEGIKKDQNQHEINECLYTEIECQQCKDNGERPFTFQRNIQHQLICPNKLVKCQYCQQNFSVKDIINHEMYECEEKEYKCKMCSLNFKSKEFIKHQGENCYIQGQETKMFDKLLEIIQNQQQQIQQLNQHIQQGQIQQQDLKNQIQNLQQQSEIQQKNIHQSQTQLRKENIYLNMLNNKLELSSKSKKQLILEDYKLGILHINDMKMLQQAIEDLQIQDHVTSVYINITDLGSYRKSNQSSLDFYSTIQFIIKLAEKGDQYSKFSLAFLYFHGDKQIERNIEKAQYWAEQCIKKQNQDKKGVSECLWILGLIQYYGNLQGQVNYRKCLEYYQNSIQIKSFGPSLHGLGKIYYQGHGAPKNTVLALNYFIKSSSLGYHQGLYYLAKFYEEGIEKQKNLDKAFDLFYDSAEKGNKQAMEELVKCYQQGLGVEKCFQQAQAWEDKAKYFVDNFL